MTLKCSCKHQFQDEVHGSGMRVHTTNKNGNYICTVCSGLKTGAVTPVAKKKK